MDERLATITPEQIGFILLLAILVIAGREWYARRMDRALTEPIQPTAHPAPPPAPPPVVQPQAPAPVARGTDGAARAHAENAGAEGAGTAPAPAESGALTTELIAMMRIIASHKLQHPTDLKSPTAKALGISKSGTSKRYALYSAAWALLYPEPVTPLRTETLDERDARIRHELAAEVS